MNTQHEPTDSRGRKLAEGTRVSFVVGGKKLYGTLRWFTQGGRGAYVLVTYHSKPQRTLAAMCSELTIIPTR